MESASAVDEAKLVSDFVEFTASDEASALQMLQATNWKLEDAVQLFFAGGLEVPAPAGGVGSQNLPAISAEPVVRFGAQVTESKPATTEALQFGDGLSASNRGPASQQDSAVLRDEGRGGAGNVLPSMGAVEPEDFVRPPIPVRREALYGAMSFGAQSSEQVTKPASVDAFRNFQEDAELRARMASGSGLRESTSVQAVGGLSSLYRPPFEIIFQGTLDEAKARGKQLGKWLLINIISTSEFSSYTMNRDTWSDPTVKETINSYFVFLQLYNDSVEGRRICSFYKIVDIPNTMVLDPLTGQKKRAWKGMRDAGQLLEDLMPFIDRAPLDVDVAFSRSQIPPPPKRPRDSSPFPEASVEASGQEEGEDEELQRALAASMESGVSQLKVLGGDEEGDRKERRKGDGGSGQEGEDGEGGEEDRGGEEEEVVLILPVEPAMGAEGVCRIAIRCPDGRRLQRRFLRTDPIQHVVAFCRGELPEASKERKKFRLAVSGPGSVPLDLSSPATIDDAGIAGAMLLLMWLE